MSAEIVNIRYLKGDSTSVKVAFPVLAYECEVYPPLNNSLDAYEKATLKLISIGLGKSGVRRTLGISESLTKQLFLNLEVSKRYIEKKKEYCLTKSGEEYLNGQSEIQPSSDSQYGFMFVSALRKDLLPFFYEGAIDRAALSDSGLYKMRLTLSGNEEKTFSADNRPKKRLLEDAYKRYIKVKEIAKRVDDNEIRIDKIQQEFSDLESDFDEADYDDAPQKVAFAMAEVTEFHASKDSLVRLLKTDAREMYLEMRLFIDPIALGGFAVESPLDLGGADNEFFSRQLQWMLKSGKPIYLGNELLSTFFDREINKLCVGKKPTEINATTFIKSKLPLLGFYKDKYSKIFDDMEEIHTLICRNDDSIEVVRRSIISNLSSRLLEPLLNRLIETVPQSEIVNTCRIAVSDYKADDEQFILRIAQRAGISRNALPPKPYTIREALKQLTKSKGNSPSAKLYNVIILSYYISSLQISAFVKQDDFEETVRIVQQLTVIRNQASHSEDKGISSEDYSFFTENAYFIANKLFNAQRSVE
jgi:hypothetical protein